jgi:hypothetical protein
VEDAQALLDSLAIWGSFSLPIYIRPSKSKTKNKKNFYHPFTVL